MDWTEVPPIIAAVAAVGLLIVAVVNLCSNLLSKAIDKRDARLGEAIDRQGEQLEKHERKNADEHSALGKRIDQVDTKITETNRKVDSGFDKVNETLRIIDGNVRELVGRSRSATAQPNEWTANATSERNRQHWEPEAACRRRSMTS